MLRIVNSHCLLYERQQVIVKQLPCLSESSASEVRASSQVGHQPSHISVASQNSRRPGVLPKDLSLMYQRCAKI